MTGTESLMDARYRPLEFAALPDEPLENPGDTRDAAVASVAALYGEIERLSAALKTIAHRGCLGDWKQVAEQYEQIANEALYGK